LHTTFNLPYVYDYITKLCRQQAEDKSKPDTQNISGLNLAVVKLTAVQVAKLPLLYEIYDRHDRLCKACTDRGLVYSAKGRIVSNMLSVYVLYAHLTKDQAYP
jgi:hypothetical protein